MSLAYYKRFPRDFLEGTIGMTLEEKGAYAIILDLIFATDGRLKDDANYIAGNLGCSVRKWNSIREKLVALGKLSCDLGIISNSRADKILDEQRSFVDKQRENGHKAHKNSSIKKPSLIPSHQPKVSQSEPEPEEEAKASSVSEPSVPRQIVKISTEEFDEVWRLWPRKDRSAKAKALSVWKARAATADPGLMLAAVKRYLGSPDAKKQNHEFVKGLHLWLRDFMDSWLEAVTALEGPCAVEMREKIFASTGMWLEEWGLRPPVHAELPLLEASR